MTHARKIIDHDEIRRWVEARGGLPARVRSTAGDRGGILRIDFRLPDQGLEPIGWEDFFKAFDDQRLAMLDQDNTEDCKAGGFVEFVAR